MGNKKILVVDDDDLMRAVTVKMLQSKYDIITAGSGQEGIDTYESEKPDLILSDLMMPEMDGFEMMERLREKHNFVIPVMFMTAYSSDDAERKGFEIGAVDYIRKPFKAEVLLHRIDNILQNVERIRNLKEAAEIEPMTGLLNKVTTVRQVDEIAGKGGGILMMVDLDSFKLVNDIYGHEAGDKVLIWFAELLRSIMRSNDIVGRVGGDEFVAFCQNVRTERMVAERTQFMNRKLLTYAKELFGEDMNIPLGVSVGAAICPDEGTDYQTLYKKADQALYNVKMAGKHNFAFFKTEEEKNREKSAEGLDEIDMLLKERDVKKGSQILTLDNFKLIYRFMMRFQRNYAWDVYLLVFRVESKTENDDDLSRMTDYFLNVAAGCLRGSDSFTRLGNNTVLAIFLKATEAEVKIPILRIRERWESDPETAGYTFSYEMQYMMPD
ncbi:GGDEF domain-containing response regulator [Butyrivibrio sp. FC2001]|uniref:GGDEF domain-containing response regulator n=1 Tax=Butyrivibrio sp. FC2001 TaxID=1280671 RepID=UPI00041DF016|nr:diguanylate cyclase [Butyrivibrio sp. FC2001]